MNPKNILSDKKKNDNLAFYEYNKLIPPSAVKKILTAQVLEKSSGVGFYWAYMKFSAPGCEVFRIGHERLVEMQ